MTRQEYKQIQGDLDNVLKNMCRKNLTSKGRDGYREAVLACKSVISHYNPERKHSTDGN